MIGWEEKKVMHMKKQQEHENAIRKIYITKITIIANKQSSCVENKIVKNIFNDSLGRKNGNAQEETVRT